MAHTSTTPLPILLLTTLLLTLTAATPSLRQLQVAGKIRTQAALLALADRAEVVASIKYELVRTALARNLTSLQIYGCQQVPSNFPELFKEAVAVHVVCTHVDCIKRTRGRGQSIDGKAVQNVRFSCSQPGGQRQQGEVAEQGLVWDSRSCNGHLCPHHELLHALGRARRSGAQLFISVDWWLNRCACMQR